jgi:NADPH-dependent 7-cyano-7-deazaguanine reductase QueF
VSLSVSCAFIQLKPQLERLELPEGQLTKEIQLTLNLMSLLCRLPDSSDLYRLTVLDADVPTKVSKVKEYVKSVMDVMKFQEKQLIEELT